MRNNTINFLGGDFTDIINKVKSTSLIVLFVLLLFPLNVFAEGNTASLELITLDSNTTIYVSFTYEGEIPDIKLISPSGEQIDENTVNAYYKETDSEIIFLIHNAESGTWSIEYTLGSDTKVNYSVKKSSMDLNYDTKNLTFIGTSDYNYIIYTVVNGETPTLTEILNGEGIKDTAVSLTEPDNLSFDYLKIVATDSNGDILDYLCIPRADLPWEEVTESETEEVTDTEESTESSEEIATTTDAKLSTSDLYSDSDNDVKETSVTNKNENETKYLGFSFVIPIIMFGIAVFSISVIKRRRFK